jgi:ribonucleoside-triphosphate reductase (thioredoxin)
MSSKEQLSWLDGCYKHLREFDKEYSKQFGWNPSIKLTTVKPSGSLSLLAGVTSGVHPATAGQYFIRRIRIASNSSLVEVCKAHGYFVEYQKNFDGTDDKSTVVVEFPCKYPDGVISAEDMDILDQLEMVKFMQTNWSDNSVSVTAYYRKEDLLRLKEYLKENFNNNFKTLSFLLYTGHGFKQAPFEPITKEQYEYIAAQVKPITTIEIDEEDVEELGACGIGGCPIK